MLAVECALANMLEVGEKMLVPVHGVFGKRMSESCENYGGEVANINFERNSFLIGIL